MVDYDFSDLYEDDKGSLGKEVARTDVSTSEIK